MGANEDRDYDEYKVKVKRYDKDGNDISGDKLGGGGRHRDNGTISAMAYDFEPLDSADDFSGMSRDELEYILAQYAYQEETAESHQDHSVIELADNIFTLINHGIDFFEGHPEAAEKLINGGKKAVLTIKKQTDKIISSIKGINKKKNSSAPSTTIQPARGSTIKESKEINISETINRPSEEMTLEQAQAEYIEFFKDFLRMKKRAERLANAHIVDADVQKLDMNQNLALMNSLVEKYPALLDDKIQFKVIEMLKASNTSENHSILSILNIDTKNEMAYRNSL
nr:hypothetical protein [uncultured Acetatifactor sp.]